MVGKSPLEIRVPYGNHTVKVDLQGFESGTRSLNLVSEAMSVPFELRKAVVRGKVALFGVPGSSVDIDGSPAGTIPFQVKLDEGSHTFTVKLPSGETFTTPRDVRFGSDGRPVTINLTTP